MDETETILNLAAQQLVLTGNIQTAVGVLEHIDSRLSRFDQAELLPIKQAVSSDLAELKTVPMSIFPARHCASTGWKPPYPDCR